LPGSESFSWLLDPEFSVLRISRLGIPTVRVARLLAVALIAVVAVLRFESVAVGSTPLSSSASCVQANFLLSSLKEV